MNQQKLSFDSPAPAAHESPTSCQAAAHMTRTGKHGTIQQQVLWILKCATDGLTDEEIAAEFVLYGVTRRFTSIVSARNALCEEKRKHYHDWRGDLGRHSSKLIRPALVENSGLRRKSPTSGLKCTVWKAVK